MCESHSEGSLLPILAWKLQMMQAGAETAFDINVLRSVAPTSGSAEAAEEKPETAAE